MRHIRFLSVCSGLEGASLAVEPLGWSPVGFAEIEAFPSAIIAERYGSNMPGDPLSRNAPPNFGDFTAIDLDALGDVDILIGGTPCQAFSVAGKRLSLADARGNLTLAYAVLAHELARSYGLRNSVWENVPGVLGTYDNAFGCFLGALVGSEYALAGCDRPRAGQSNWFWEWSDKERNHRTRWPDFGMVAGPAGKAAWRVFDAQWFGLAQRRERVFVVADFGNGADPAAVLFERQGLRGNSPPRREKGQGTAGTLAARTRGGGGLGTDFDCDGGLVAAFGGGNPERIETATTLTAHGHRLDFESETVVAHALRAEGFDASEDGTGRGTPIIPVAFSCKDYGHDMQVNMSPTLRAMGGNVANGGGQVAVCYGLSTQQEPKWAENISPTLALPSKSGGGQITAVAFAQNTRDEVRIQGGDGQIVGALVAEPGMKQTTYVAVSDPDSFAFDLRGREGGAMPEGPHDTANLRAASGGSSRSYVAQPFAQTGAGWWDNADVATPLRAEGGDNGGGSENAVATRWAVRRLTPTECERLQGVPDNYTRIAWRGKPPEQCPDGPRYKALGNSWAVPVVRWICSRLDAELRKDAK